MCKIYDYVKKHLELMVTANKWHRYLQNQKLSCVSALTN